MLEKIPRDVALHVGLSWLLSLPTWGVDMDELACPLHRPTAYSRKTRGQGFLPGVVLFHCATVGGGAILWDTKPPGLDICEGADRLGTCVVKFHIERVAFTRISSP
jgi:hypothetical protein